jgi:hypothetical protein
MSVLCVSGRSLLTAGTALALTGALIASTSTAPPDATPTVSIAVAAPAVQLTAAPNPLEFYPQIAQRSISNVGALAWEYAVVVPALAGALVTNPLGIIQAAASMAPVLLLFSPVLIPGYAVASVSPLLSGVAGAALSLTEIRDAVTSGSPADLVNAVVDLPGRVVDGLLNGVPGAPLYGIGILTPATGGGPSLLGLPGVIAQMVLTGAGVEFPDPYEPPWAPSALTAQRTTSAATSASLAQTRRVSPAGATQPAATTGTGKPAPRGLKKPQGNSARSATERPARRPSARG